MDLDQAIQRHLMEFMSKREPPKTFCPSEVARSLTHSELSSGGLNDWREAMDRVRAVAQDRRSDDVLEVLQKGEVIDSSIHINDIKGPIRLRRRPGVNDI